MSNDGNATTIGIGPAFKPQPPLLVIFSDVCDHPVETVDLEKDFVIVRCAEEGCGKPRMKVSRRLVNMLRIAFVKLQVDDRR